MRWLSALGSGLVLVVALAAAAQADVDVRKASLQKAKVVEVQMLDNEFKPKDVTINAGDSVIWVNKGKETHTATSDDGKTFDTGDVKNGAKSKALKFEKKGKIPYHCKPHEDEMKGTITVK